MLYSIFLSFKLAGTRSKINFFSVLNVLPQNEANKKADLYMLSFIFRITQSNGHTLQVRVEIYPHTQCIYAVHRSHLSYCPISLQTAFKTMQILTVLQFCGGNIRTVLIFFVVVTYSYL